MQNENNNEFAAFINLFSEWHPKTTIKKVNQIKRSKVMNNEHLGATPFEYLKNPNDPKIWLVYKAASATIQRIFQMALDELGCSVISTKLWRNKVLTPSAYKASKGLDVTKRSENLYCWKSSAVGAILDKHDRIDVTKGLELLWLSFKSKRSGYLSLK